MAHHALLALGHASRDYPAIFFVLGFVFPIFAAYVFFAWLPYRAGRLDGMLSPRHVVRPAVPGVLERYATWEWASQPQLTSFGRWLFQELGHQDRSLAGLAREADMDLAHLMPHLYRDSGAIPGPAMIRTLARLLGASEREIDELVQAERNAREEVIRYR